jgi:hypothetical protein
MKETKYSMSGFMKIFKMPIMTELTLLLFVIIFFESFFLTLKLDGNLICTEYKFSSGLLVILLFTSLFSFANFGNIITEDAKRSVFRTFMITRGLAITYSIIRRITITFYHFNYCSWVNYWYYLLGDILILILIFEYGYAITYHIRTKYKTIEKKA